MAGRKKFTDPLPERPNFDREDQLVLFGYEFIAGADEAGRGPLAGPVVAGAVRLPRDFHSPTFHLLHDSKQLDHNTRELLYEELVVSVAWGVGECSPGEIDNINIRQASWLAMQRAVEDLSRRFATPDYVLIDGLPYGPGPWPYEALVKGDARSLNIAAASIIAKVTRDRHMILMEEQFPGYGFASHKGYPCPAHLRALDELGPCSIHRYTFSPIHQKTGSKRLG